MTHIKSYSQEQLKQLYGKLKSKPSHNGKYREIMDGIKALEIGEVFPIVPDDVDGVLNTQRMEYIKRKMRKKLKGKEFDVQYEKSGETDSKDRDILKFILVKRISCSS